MKKIFIFLIIGFLVGLQIVGADEDFSKAEEIIKQKIPCEKLTNEQFEILGDYFMEQMHPGEAHERMDAMMGGEGSQTLKQVHINMGKSFYCGERGAIGVGMMNMMMGRGMIGNGMGMMSGYGNMIGNAYYGNGMLVLGILGWLITILIIIVLILIMLLLIKQLLKGKNDKRSHKK